MKTEKSKFRPALKHAAAMLLMGCSLISAQSTIPDYSLTERKDVPVEYTWNLEDIYKTREDWEKDKKLVVELIGKIEKHKADWSASAAKMYDMIKLINDISQRLDKLYTYAARWQHVDLGNSVYRKMTGDIQTYYVDFGQKTSFINNDILKLGEKKFAEYVKKEPGLKNYKFRAENLFRLKDHILSPEKQEIVSMTNLFSGAAEQASGVLNNLEIPPSEVTLSDGKKITLNIANYLQYRASKIPEDRSLVMNTFWNNRKKYENTLAILLDSEMKQHFFNAKVHGYSDCLQARLAGNNIDTSVYYQLIRSVNSNLEPLHKYLKLKKELMGLQKYRYDDIYASAVEAVDKTYPYDEAKKIIYEAAAPLGTEYKEGLTRAFNERWIDIYPNKGKEFGAYSGGLYGVHPYIKMNYNGKYESLSTLFHELGHTLHSYLTNKNQPYENTGYATFVAEVASTFNENLLVNYMMKNEKDDLLKLFILDSYLDGVRATIYRQTLFAEFELAMHKKVEQGGSLTPDWLSKTYLDLTRHYYGHNKGVMEVGDYIQNEWSIVSHFYMNYYVFQYSTGIIASMALSDMVLNGGEKEKEKYLAVLKAGGSDYPVEVLKKADLDMTRKESIDRGLHKFSHLVDEMENLVTKLKQEAKL